MFFSNVNLEVQKAIIPSVCFERQEAAGIVLSHTFQPRLYEEQLLQDRDRHDSSQYTPQRQLGHHLLSISLLFLSVLKRVVLPVLSLMNQHG